MLHVIWRDLGLPKPTAVQNDMADYLQRGPRLIVIEAFRGVGKSWITAAFCVYLLYWNPDAKILIVSASGNFANNISTFILQIIRKVPQFNFLDCAGRERHSKISFDVGPAKPDKQPSVSSLGITSQLTGNRADFILSDDVESFANSLTQLARERNSEATKEYQSIIKPTGRICFLGTPQTEHSLYNALPARGFEIRLWPIQYPTQDQRAIYGDRLAPMLAADLDGGHAQAGDPTDPLRFNALEIATKRAAYGRAGFALQYMLDTTLSDSDRYPLRLRDLIVMAVNPDVAPERVLWTGNSGDELRDLECVGLDGDRYYGGVVPEGAQWGPYKGCVMAVDPAGGGKDETAYAILKQKNGVLYCPEATGLPGGYSDATMVALATAAKRNGVRHIVVERNFGAGMFTKLLEPHVQRIHPCTIEEVHHALQKERRIIDTLEPVLNQHRLVVDRTVVERDAHRNGDPNLTEDVAPRYQLFFQMAHLTTEKGCLAHDDRLDALAIGVAYWVEALAQDVNKSAAADRRRKLALDLEAFVRGTLDGLDTGRRPAPRNWLGHNAGTAGRIPHEAPAPRDPEPV